jgi:uncharacterized phage-associated protein
MHLRNIKFRIDREKSIAVMLFIINKLGHIDIHKLFKIIYFADQEHLLRFGKPITGDWYVAMKDGPVPSNIYDLVKTIRGEMGHQDAELENKFEIKRGFLIYPKEASDIDELTGVEIECILHSIEDNKDLGYKALVKKSHDAAYDKADRNNMIAYEDIAKAAGANEELINYIATSAENKRFSLKGKFATC